MEEPLPEVAYKASTMSRLKEWLGPLGRGIKLCFFQVLVLFWLIKIGYCVRGYFANGIMGLRSVVLHGAPIPSDSRVWGHPQWGQVGLRYAAIAMLTLGLWSISRSELRQWWTEIRHGRDMK